VLSWDEFQHRRPDLAEAGRRLLYQFGVGLGFLATVRTDGGPRLHPMCPLLTDDALVGFLHPSPSARTCTATAATPCTRSRPRTTRTPLWSAGEPSWLPIPTAARRPPTSSWPNGG
jgi:hypothetical protein